MAGPPELPRDYRALKMSGIDDEAMVFSNPVREKVGVA